MNPRIWSRLPDHLLERVLSFLPLKTFLSLRSTCKHFNSLLFSPCFISKYYSSSSSSPLSSFIVLSHPQFSPKCPIYNTVVNSWNSRSLSCPDPMLTCPPNSTLLSSSNGLLCFSMPRSSCFVVCSPLSRSLHRVKFPTYPFGFELLTLISNPSGFKLFMINTIGSSIKTQVYSSKSSTWQQFEGFDPMIINSTHDQKGVLYDNSLLFTTPENHHHPVLGFDLDTGKWEEKSRIRLPGSLTFSRLASDGDQKLFLIGGVGVSGISRSIKLWELNENGENWTEIETLPEMVCRKFLSVCYHNYQHVYCFWHQGLICVCCYTWPEILYYKVSRRTWHWLPKCPSLPDKWSCGFKWFSFKPELYATV